MATDPNALLRAAEQHHANGAPAAALPLIEQVLRIAPGHPQILQFHAILLRALRRQDEALRSIAAAHAASPRDPRIADTLGNVLGDLGRYEEAVTAYDRALAADPAFAPARLHRGAALQELGRIEEARAGYAALGDNVDALSALAGLEMDEGELDRAADLLNRALTLAPNHAGVARARVRVALDRGEAQAHEGLRRLVSAYPDDPDLLIEAIEELGQPQHALAIERRLTAEPGWHAGRRALALHRRQRERRSDWLALHEAALAARPRDSDLWRGLIELNNAVDDFSAAAAVARRAAQTTGDVGFRAAAFAFHDAAGEADAAAELLDDRAIAPLIPPLAIAKHLLRRRDPEGAEALLAVLPQNVETWALRGLAWQLLGDPRWKWLNGQSGMVASFDLGLDADQRSAVIERLRALHADAMLHIGHSVRAGTQTHGNLFDRIEPELRQAKAAILDAVETYRAGLPPADPTHPILRHRDAAWRMTASWSIRLSGGGFHISHIHPKGIVSSASYWVVPQASEAGPDGAGWLELGRPPAYLGIDLAPIATIEPMPGRLVLFPSTLHHGTRPIEGGERITAAFDLAPRRS
ncbi:tetratricopeptide repeat protein [Sphingomonas sp. MMS24-J13]|uniref:tetratricopeptide repeat protein n=1 Tax=Sphingomonas sp. MMS24-J13 TaxID=3238686 RepID=UPI00384D0C1A